MSSHRRISHRVTEDKWPIVRLQNALLERGHQPGRLKNSPGSPTAGRGALERARPWVCYRRSAPSGWSAVRVERWRTRPLAPAHCTAGERTCSARHTEPRENAPAPPRHVAPRENAPAAPGLVSLFICLFICLFILKEATGMRPFTAPVNSVI